jgi:hypothetical protein
MSGRQHRDTATSAVAQRDALVGSGAVTDDEFDETQRYLGDPDCHILTPVLYAAWGRGPG